jgi:alpha-tubulin suppressor-like RCC1 family protein
MLNIKQICNSGNSTFILTHNNELYSIGNNYYGQLCVGNNECVSIFQKVKFENQNLLFEKISCGNDFIFVLTTDGKVYSCGNNLNGQLGLGHNNNINSLANVKIKDVIIDIFCGAKFTFLLSKSHELYSCGENFNGQLGLGHNNNTNTFTKIKIQNIKNISINGTSIFAFGNNDVYGCGSNIFCELGVKGGKNLNFFKKIDNENFYKKNENSKIENENENDYDIIK